MTTRWAFLTYVVMASAALMADDTAPKKDHDAPVPASGPRKAGGPKPTSGLCDRLFRFSCAPGEYDDGTGIARSKDLVADKMDQIKREQSKVYGERFAAEMAKTPRLRAAAIAAFELNDSPDCEDREGEGDEAQAKARRQRCDKTLSDALAELSLDRLFDSPAGGGLKPRGFSLRGMDYLLHSPAFKRVESELGTNIREKLVDKKSAEAVEKEIFPEVRDSIVALIDKMVLNPQDKKKMKEKVKSIEFGGTDCTRLNGGDEASVMGSLIPNAFYSSSENAFRYCNGYLMQSTSRFQIVHVIAHELSHSIDPCQIASDFEGSAVAYTNPTDQEDCEKEYPFSGVIPCLRNSESVGAKRRAPASADPLFGIYGPAGGAGIPPLPLTPAPPLPKIEFGDSGTGSGGDSGAGAGDSGPEEAPKPKIVFPELKPKKDAKAPGGILPLPGKHFPGDGHNHGVATAYGPYGGIFGDPVSPFCLEEDQITEAFADRIADEILPDYIEKHHAGLTEEQKRIGYSNVYRGACPRKTGPPGYGQEHDVHPETEKRVDRSLLVHPKVRKQMGCLEAPPEGRRFCPLVAAEVPKVVKKAPKPPANKRAANPLKADPTKPSGGGF